MTKLYEKIQQDITVAMKAKDAEKTNILRNIFSEFKKFAIDNRAPGTSATSIEDADALKVLKKLEKQRRDSIDQFEKGNRVDLVAKEQAELALIMTYLPQQLSASELMPLITQAIAKLQAKSAKDFGLVMKEVLAQVQGRADSKEVSALIKNELEK